MIKSALNAQLIDIATGDNLWANRFDRDIASVFALQEEMSHEIAKALGVKPSEAERERMARPPTANLEAYDYYLRAEQAARYWQSRLDCGKRWRSTTKAEELDPSFRRSVRRRCARDSLYLALIVQ